MTTMTSLKDRGITEGARVRCGGGKIAYTVESIVTFRGSDEVRFVNLTAEKTGRSKLVRAGRNAWGRQATTSDLRPFAPIAKGDRQATHNGTCQVCGRAQASAIDGARLAKHGYNVAWGFFMGVCSGAHNLPIELDTTILDATVLRLREEATRLEAIMPRDIEKTVVKVPTGEYTGRGRSYKKVTEDLEIVGEAGWNAYRASEAGIAQYGEVQTASSYYGADRWTWAYKQERIVEGLRDGARQMRAHAANLEELKTRRAGKPLYARD